ncbi:MAG: hypothetical protein ACRC5H_07240 [Treponemataceae bacterium]
MKIYKNTIFFCIIVFFILGCSKKDNSSTPVEADELLHREIWNVDFTYHIFFGYNFNDEDFVQSTLALLYNTFGSKEDGGLISYSVYPDDYATGKRIRIANLLNMLEKENVQGLITLGAPEGIHSPIEQLQDEGWNYPVYSLFSQEEPLASQSISTLVIDSATKIEDGDEQVAIEKDDIVLLLTKFIIFMKSNSDLDKTEIKTQLEKKLSGWNTTMYVDAETGLAAFNHFIIERQ